MMMTYADLEVAIVRAVRNALRYHPLQEDAIQEAQIEAWRRHQADPGTPLGHLLVAARRRAMDVAIGKQAFGAPERTKGSGSRIVALEHLAPTFDRAEDPLLEAQGTRLVRDALDTLPDQERVVAIMILQGYKQREIAAAFERSESWVNTRMIPKIRAGLEGWLPALRAA